MNADDGLRLLNELLAAEDDELSELLDDSDDSDDRVVSVTPTLDVEAVIRSVKEHFQQQNYSNEEDEDDNESVNDALDDEENDPDYIPSTDTSFVQSAILVTETAPVINDIPTSSHNELSTSTSQVELPLLIQPSTSTSQVEQPLVTQPSTSTSQVKQPLVTQPSTSTSQVEQPLLTQPSTSTSQVEQPLLTQPSTSTSQVEQPLLTQPSTSSPQVEEINRRSRKRQRNPDQWKKNIKKRKIIKGEEYITKTGKIKAARKTGPDCHCRLKCFDKVNEIQREIILKAFNELDNTQLQDAYLGSCISSIPPKRSRPRTGTKATGKGSRKWTYEYTVKPENMKTKVCFKAFMSLHGIGLTRAKRVRTPGVALPVPDQRGRHCNHFCISKEIKGKIVAHINSFPKRESHYSRKNNLNRRYLDERLNVKRMWLLYLEKHEPAQRLLYRTDRKAMRPIVKYKFYLHIFNSCFNLTFGQPRSDTCPLCDKYDILIQAENDIEQKKSIQDQRDLHQMRADSGYQTLNSYIERSKTDQSSEVYTFDFQQNLPAPSLTAGDMFYSRMLWTYNFGLHDAKTADGIMHMWSEAEAGRGSSEVCSCLRETILKRHEIHKGDHLILFSDGCAGQNKNKAMMNFLFELAKDGVYKSIQHMFLFRGHTFLPNDRDFSHIEKRKKVEKVKRPSDWNDIVKDSRLSQPFETVFLDHTNFFDYKALADAKIKPTFKCSDGINLRFKDVMWFSYGASKEMNDLMDAETWKPHTEEVWCRYTHNVMESWKKLNPMKRLKKNQSTPELAKKYSKPIGIKALKKKDLLSLATKGLVDEHTKEFYESLPVRLDKNTLDSDEEENDYL